MELVRSHRRVLLVAACSGAAIALVAVFTVDGSLAVALASLSPDSTRVIQSFVRVVEVLFAVDVSPYASDVIASAAIAAFVTLAYVSVVLERGLKR